MKFPKISIVVPVYNNEETLGACLQALRNISYPNFEIIVVNDASTDNSATIAKRYNCRFMQNTRNRGVAYSRNKGAEIAAGNMVAFIDSDIIVTPHGISQAFEQINQNGAGAVAGLFSEQVPFRNLCSRYKNHWVRFTHLNDRDQPVVLFGSGCLIDRELLLQVGGFDENYRKPNVEDTEIGSRIYAKGKKIILLSEFHLKHQKRYNLWTLLKTDYERARGLTRMILRRGPRKVEHRTCITLSTVLTVPLACLTTLLICLSFVSGSWLWLVAAASSLSGIFFLNQGLLRYLRSHFTPIEFLGSTILFFLDMLAAGLGIGVGILGYLLGYRY
jgi:glycosyltransferase involved in cell wall biosynthesis